MNIIILALGSTGDVLPYIALGAQLRKAGHAVCIATFENFKAQVAANGLAYHPIQGDSQAILGSASGQGIAQSGRNVVRLAAAIMRSFGALAKRYAGDLVGLSERKIDLIINQLPGGLYGWDLAEKRRVPMVLASVIPLVPTARQPMLAFPTQFSRVPGYNLATHWIAYQIVWQGFRSTINRWRQEILGLDKAPWGGYFRKYWQEIPVLNGFSAHVVQPPPDWGPQIHVTGYWFPKEPDWEPSTALRRFIEAGTPPVFIGFGSMPLDDPQAVSRLILEAIRQSGQRALLQVGWAGLGKLDLPAAVFKLEHAPYEWLFPQMAAVVHHGGSGTTAFGLRSGIPNLVVPFTFDQFYWGQRIHALGVGPRPIPFQKLTAGRLAQAISKAVDNPETRSSAGQLAVKIRAEDGLGRAVTILEGMQAN